MAATVPHQHHHGAHPMAHNRFKRGSAMFVCRVCGKRTRDVNGSNGHLELCELCEYAAGHGNTLSDAGYKGGDAWDMFEKCKTMEECDALLDQELKKLGVA